MKDLKKEHIKLKISEKEIFKDIINYEGLYQVSNLGTVRSLNYNGTGKIKTLKPLNINSYGRVVLCKDNKKKNFKINRLVAQAFLGLDINNKKVIVCHKSEKLKENGLLNDSYNNLFLGNSKDNTFDMMTKKRSNTVGIKGKNHLQSKKVNQFSLDGKFIKTWECMNDVFRELGIYSANISKCCKGIRSHTGGFKWKYEV